MRATVNIYISDRVQAKLAGKHQVTADEIRHCFENREGTFLEDNREEHKTDPPTQWFIAETNQRRVLKVVFILERLLKGSRINIRTAYEPNATEVSIYNKHAK
jgi:hypothetical protein